jgi:Fe2+ or Zn2+ uptake regulation protein
MEDVDVPPNAEHELKAIVESLGSEAGFRVLDHVLEVEGVCGRCDKTEREASDDGQA